MPRRLLVLLAVVCVAALGVTAVALAQSSSGGDRATHEPARSVGKKHGHHPCKKHHPGDGRMTPGGRRTSTPLT
jgi:hypothetical protein